jgi:hypothetical protein
MIRPDAAAEDILYQGDSFRSIENPDIDNLKRASINI